MELCYRLSAEEAGYGSYWLLIVWNKPFSVNWSVELKGHSLKYGDETTTAFCDSDLRTLETGGDGDQTDVSFQK